MEPLTVHEGIAALLDRTNVDTDQIIPKQFLKRVSRSGYGDYLFYDWRFLENGSDNPDFELNKQAFKGASILVAGDNFGCGSSREHAPWSLLDYGFRVVVSTSFADIFYHNCFKNGVLPALVQAADLSELMSEINENEGVQFKIDLAAQQLTTPKGSVVGFEVDEFRKECLLGGLDDISWTMQFNSEISEFEAKQRSAEPWLWSS
jgi:3-isopropylmalate/(R)-2-methylmalate dehydratase small subunit